MTTDDTISAVARHLAQARRILFITGAGISADSGLPTYRGVGGLYDSDLTAEGLRIEEVLSGEVFALRPDLTWKYLIQIEENCRGAQPNAAHRAIALLGRHLERVMVFTQNVDGLHQRAGSQRGVKALQIGGEHRVMQRAGGWLERAHDVGAVGHLRHALGRDKAAGFDMGEAGGGQMPGGGGGRVLSITGGATPPQ